MGLVTCADCGESISDAAASCVHCGRERALDAAYPFFPVATHKFVLLSLTTLGFYQLFWCYQQWKRIQIATGESISPFWRAVWAPLWGFSLFARIHRRGVVEGLEVEWASGFLGTVFLLLSMMWRLPDPWWLIGYFNFLAVIPVQRTADQVNARARSSESPNRHYGAANVLTIIIGGALVLLAFLGTLEGEP